MNRISPFGVGTTVKWRERDRECAGIVVEVHAESSDGSVPEDPRYVVRLTDQSEISKFHSELVVV